MGRAVYGCQVAKMVDYVDHLPAVSQLYILHALLYSLLIEFCKHYFPGFLPCSWLPVRFYQYKELIEN